jgi:hypothetical protein
MKFKLMTVGSFYTAEGAKALADAFGFKFEESSSFPWLPMSKSYDDEGNQQVGVVDMHTIEDLMAFVQKWGDVIIRPDATMIIYDDYTEG